MSNIYQPQIPFPNVHGGESLSGNESETSRARATAGAKVSTLRAEYARRQSGDCEGSVCLGRQAAPSGQRDRYAAEPAERQPAPRLLARQRRGTQWNQPLSAGRRRRRSTVSCPLTFWKLTGPQAPPSLPCSPRLTCLRSEHLHKDTKENATPPLPPSGIRLASIKWRLAGGGNSNQPIIRRLLGTLAPMSLKLLE